LGGGNRIALRQTSVVLVDHGEVDVDGSFDAHGVVNIKSDSGEVDIDKYWEDSSGLGS
jgi:hypothetical protein